MGRRAVFGVLVAIAVVAFTYFSSEKQSVPVTGRTQRVAMSDTQQEQLGLQVFDQTLQEQQGAGNVITTGAQYAQVERVAKRIAKVGAVDKPEFEWAVALVRSDEVNAFCLPGGKIVVYTGLLDVARTDDELATVLGHEVAHAVAEHGAERILREQLTQRAVTAASGAFADDPQRYQQVAGLLGAGAQVGLSLPWGRAQASSTWHAPATTRPRRSPSGSACSAPPRGARRPSTCRPTPRARHGSSRSRAGSPRPSASGPSTTRSRATSPHDTPVRRRPVGLRGRRRRG
jgi:hypothetical protein